uniref:Uncharacterized protein n=1 Tax=Chromera velia CCMP2878 TaxID=1169474 RepID=A0A0G4GFH1_9ALVE|eukprot:Cvel_21665.t1-p1 / transcript=Cvel_21665.t1 / gene=Cvel_21665 / organism=Chromera_velia_CCMP2878 / gene_product=Cingulin, putative / transcript_product=Cingulin, putative / location=Cvel_scaffold2051:10205-21410(-) / protein_length=1554 / sequence_SO=supercontig / SO=protein_coding / is_pseudo=false
MADQPPVNPSQQRRSSDCVVFRPPHIDPYEPARRASLPATIQGITLTPVVEPYLLQARTAHATIPDRAAQPVPLNHPAGRQSPQAIHSRAQFTSQTSHLSAASRRRSEGELMLDSQVEEGAAQPAGRRRGSMPYNIGSKAEDLTGSQNGSSIQPMQQQDAHQQHHFVPSPAPPPPVVSEVTAESSGNRPLEVLNEIPVSDDSFHTNPPRNQNAPARGRIDPTTKRQSIDTQQQQQQQTIPGQKGVQRRFSSPASSVQRLTKIPSGTGARLEDGHSSFIQDPPLEERMAVQVSGLQPEGSGLAAAPAKYPHGGLEAPPRVQRGSVSSNSTHGPAQPNWQHPVGEEPSSLQPYTSSTHAAMQPSHPTVFYGQGSGHGADAEATETAIRLQRAENERQRLRVEVDSVRRELLQQQQRSWVMQTGWHNENAALSQSLAEAEGDIVALVAERAGLRAEAEAVRDSRAQQGQASPHPMPSPFYTYPAPSLSPPRIDSYRSPDRRNGGGTSAPPSPSRFHPPSVSCPQEQGCPHVHNNERTPSFSYGAEEQHQNQNPLISPASKIYSFDFNREGKSENTLRTTNEKSNTSPPVAPRSAFTSPPPFRPSKPHAPPSPSTRLSGGVGNDMEAREEVRRLRQQLMERDRRLEEREQTAKRLISDLVTTRLELSQQRQLMLRRKNSPPPPVFSSPADGGLSTLSLAIPGDTTRPPKDMGDAAVGDSERDLQEGFQKEKERMLERDLNACRDALEAREQENSRLLRELRRACVEAEDLRSAAGAACERAERFEVAREKLWTIAGQATGVQHQQQQGEKEKGGASPRPFSSAPVVAQWQQFESLLSAQLRKARREAEDEFVRQTGVIQVLLEETAMLQEGQTALERRAVSAEDAVAELQKLLDVAESETMKMRKETERAVDELNAERIARESAENSVMAATERAATAEAAIDGAVRLSKGHEESTAKVLKEKRKIEKENEDLCQRLARQDRQISTLVSEIHRLNEDVGAAGDRETRSGQREAAAVQRAAVAEERSHCLEQEVKEMKERLCRESAQGEDERAELLSQRSSLRQKLSHMQPQLEGLSRECERLKRLLAEARAEQSESEEKANRISTRERELEEQNEHLARAVERNKADEKMRFEETAQLVAEVKRLKKIGTDKEETFLSASAEAGKLRAHVETLTEREKCLEAEVLRVRKEADRASVESELVQGDLKACRRDLETARREAVESRKESRLSATSAKEAATETDQLRLEKKALEKDLKIAKGDLEDREELRRTFSAEREASRAELRRLEADIDTLQREAAETAALQKREGKEDEAALRVARLETDRLRKEVFSLQAAQTESQGREESLRFELSRLRLVGEEAEDRERQRVRLEKANAELKEKLSSLQKKVQNAEKANRTLQTERNHLATAKESLELHLSSMRTRTRRAEDEADRAAEALQRDGEARQAAELADSLRLLVADERDSRTLEKALRKAEKAKEKDKDATHIGEGVSAAGSASAGVPGAKPQIQQPHQRGGPPPRPPGPSPNGQRNAEVGSNKEKEKERDRSGTVTPREGVRGAV